MVAYLILAILALVLVHFYLLYICRSNGGMFEFNDDEAIFVKNDRYKQR